MTDKELRKQIQDAPKPINHQEKWYKEHSAREMINSCLAYGNYNRDTTAKEIREHERNRYKDYLKQYEDELGEERLLQLIEEQKNDLYAIVKDTFVDDEFVHYNGIVWKDDFDGIAQANAIQDPNKVVFFKKIEVFAF